MRNIFLETLTAAARDNPDIWLMCGDLGYSVLEPFIKEFPGRFINAGVAEQNMTSVAAGLALSGKKVFIYSIINFVTLRCFEQIRNDICYHNADVKVVGVGSGLCYGPQGYTHYAIEDIAAMRALPRMTVICPGDPIEARWATGKLVTHKGPAYLRLAKAGEPNVHTSLADDLPFGCAISLRPGGNLTLIATGNMLETARDVALLLAKDGLEARVVSMPSMKPFDDDFISSEASRVPLIATLEEHTRYGGLAEATSYAMSTTRITRTKAKLISFSVPETICSGLVGDQNNVRRMLNLAPDQIAERLKTALQEHQN